MDAAAVRRWKAGQELAAAQTAEAARAMPIGERVEALVTLARSARALGWSTTNAAEVDGVRARFARLHALLGVHR